MENDNVSDDEVRNSVSKTILARRTIRRFLDKDVPDDVIKKIIEAGTWAPSACNVQGWRFVVVKDKNIKQKIVDAGAAVFIKDAPAAVFVFYDNRTDNVEYNDHIQSASACIQNMLLAAWEHKVGGCWICHLPLKSQLRRVLRVPGYYDPIACVAIGYFDNAPNPLPRKLPVSELMSCDKFDFKVEQKSKLKLSGKRLGRRLYYRLPFRKHIKPVVDKIFEKKFGDRG